MMRKAQLARRTNETDIVLSLDLDGSGKAEIDTGVGFLDHMLTLFAHHGRFDLSVKCKGDTQVDAHHTTEDIAICLGKCFAEVLGEMRGVTRYGDILLPMDETLIQCAVDLSGRSCLRYSLEIPAQKVGDFDTELTEEFFQSFVRSANITLHIRQLDGMNSHHIIEGAFKAVARALAKAVRIDPTLADEVPSSKGVL